MRRTPPCSPSQDDGFTTTVVPAAQRRVATGRTRAQTCHRSVARWAVSTQRPRGACLTMLAVAERTDHHRSATHLAVRSQQKLALGRPISLLASVNEEHNFSQDTTPDQEA